VEITSQAREAAAVLGMLARPVAEELKALEVKDYLAE